MRNPDVPTRIIPCLDVCGDRVVKGRQFVDLQDAGDPVELAKQYEADGADELVFLDISATNENRRTLTDRVKTIADQIFIPFTVGGGIRTVEDAQAVLDSGADKIAINSAAIDRPCLITELAQRMGSQSVVLSIDAKRSSNGTTWDAYKAGGKKPTGLDAVDWANKGADLGAGEILMTSIDQDGVNRGYDRELMATLSRVVKVPIIASGGAGQLGHLSDTILSGSVDAVLCASALHRGELSIPEIKAHLMDRGIPVRPVAELKTFERSKSLDKLDPNIAIVDYGMGNHYSLAAALAKVGANPFKSNKPDELLEAHGLVLPGVGAFPAAMERLNHMGLIEVINRFKALGRPILGVCLGYQLLFEASTEQGETSGLGWLNGKVSEMDLSISPDMGWREVRLKSSRMSKGLGKEALFYHVHKFAADPTTPSIIKGISMVGRTPKGQMLKAASIVQKDNVYGTQFHPEKSSSSGLRLMANFVDVCT